jgi:putative oxidoreductase
MDLALLILRAVGGVIMVAHGLPKWPNRERVVQNWTQDGMPFPRPILVVTYLVEVPVSAIYLVGLLTGWGSLALIALMLGVTWWSVYVKREPLVSYGSKGYDVNLALIALLLATALAGGGAYSLDALFGISPYWPIR